MHDKLYINLTFSTIKNEPNKEHTFRNYFLFSPKEKCCWCIQHYLWDV